MTVNELIDELTQLSQKGHGDKDIMLECHDCVSGSNELVTADDVCVVDKEVVIS